MPLHIRRRKSDVNHPTISVIIPTYNRRESLRLTLEGLSRQTYPSDLFEVVIVSDGSTDGTDEFVAEFAAQSSFSVKYFKQQNAGPSQARNRAIEESANEIIVLLDDDVDPVPGFLESHAGWHRDNDRLGIIGPMLPDPEHQKIESSWILWEHLKLQRIYAMFQPGGDFEKSHAGPIHFYSGNASVKRKWLVLVHGFDLRYKRQEDVELATRLNAECGIMYKFDFTAVGLHRPFRTFKSWLKIPSDYGKLDARRVIEGNMSYDRVAYNAQNRHALNTFVVAVAGIGPLPSAVMSAALKAVSLGASAVKLHSIALAALSGLYNVTYLTDFKNEFRRLKNDREKTNATEPQGETTPTEIK